jgi:hypothetical protein
VAEDQLAWGQIHHNRLLVSTQFTARHEISSHTTADSSDFASPSFTDCKPVIYTVT